MTAAGGVEGEAALGGGGGGGLVCMVWESDQAYLFAK